LFCTAGIKFLLELFQGRQIQTAATPGATEDLFLHLTSFALSIGSFVVFFTLSETGSRFLAEHETNNVLQILV
jgi:hypothetical protein